MRRCAVLALVLGASACEQPAPPERAPLRLELSGERCALLVRVPPPALDVALVCGAQLLDRPWNGAGEERLVVALDADGLIPLAPRAEHAGEHGVELPLAAVRASLGTSGRYVQARWRTRDGAWALGSAWHLRATRTSAGEETLELAAARRVAAPRAAPAWLALLGALSAAWIAGTALRSTRARLSTRVLAGAFALLAGAAAFASVPRMARDLVDLRWRPEPELRSFFARVAERVSAWPPDLLVVVDGPPAQRARAAEALPTARFAHRAPDARSCARLGPDLVAGPDELELERWGAWVLLGPRALLAPR